MLQSAFKKTQEGKEGSVCELSGSRGLFVRIGWCFFCQAFLILAPFSISCTHTHSILCSCGHVAVCNRQKCGGLGFFFFFIFIASHSKSGSRELKLSFATPLTYTDLIMERKWPTPQVQREKWAIKLVKLQVLNLTCTSFGEKVADRQKLKGRNLRTVTNTRL